MGEILLVGDDSILLATRAAILTRTGAKVVCCPSAECPDHVLDHDVALIILCHTLEDEAAETVASATPRHWPKARLVRLQQGMGRYPAIACDSNVVHLEGPRQLLNHVRGMLSSSNSSSNGQI
ncbi:MAG: hypothetical protein NVSMB62_13790 [Acidobacteriaceae bacterium]